MFDTVSNQGSSIQHFLPSKGIYQTRGFRQQGASYRRLQTDRTYKDDPMIQMSTYTIQGTQNSLNVGTSSQKTSCESNHFTTQRQKLAFCPLTRPLVTDQRTHWKTNHQCHFSNTLHSAASHIPTKPQRLPFFFSLPSTYCRTQLHIRASQTRGPLWDTEPTVGLYSLPCKAEPLSLHYNLFHMLWRVTVQDTGKGSGSQLNIRRLVIHKSRCRNEPAEKVQALESQKSKERNVRRGGGKKKRKVRGSECAGVRQPPERTSVTRLESS